MLNYLKSVYSVFIFSSIVLSYIGISSSSHALQRPPAFEPEPSSSHRGTSYDVWLEALRTGTMYPVEEIDFRDLTPRRIGARVEQNLNAFQEQESSKLSRERENLAATAAQTRVQAESKALELQERQKELQANLKALTAEKVASYTRESQALAQMTSKVWVMESSERELLELSEALPQRVQALKATLQEQVQALFERRRAEAAAKVQAKRSVEERIRRGTISLTAYRKAMAQRGAGAEEAQNAAVRALLAEFSGFSDTEVEEILANLVMDPIREKERAFRQQERELRVSENVAAKAGSSASAPVSLHDKKLALWQARAQKASNVKELEEELTTFEFAEAFRGEDERRLRLARSAHQAAQKSLEDATRKAEIELEDLLKRVRRLRLS